MFELRALQCHGLLRMQRRRPESAIPIQRETIVIQVTLLLFPDFSTENREVLPIAWNEAETLVRVHGMAMQRHAGPVSAGDTAVAPQQVKLGILHASCISFSDSKRGSTSKASDRKDRAC